MHVSLWPGGLIGRVIAIMMIAILLEFLGSIILHDQVDRYTVREDHARRVAELLVVGERLLDGAEPARRDAILDILSTEHLLVEQRAKPTIGQAATGRDLQSMHAQIVKWEPSLADKSLRLETAQSVTHPGRRDLVGALRLEDGQWLEFRSRDLFGHWPQLYWTIGAAAILAGGVLLAAALVVRTLGSPLRALASAADRVGHGKKVLVLEEGPRDLGQVARAFNAMQDRIGGLIADRTQALAAVGHDLRTPLSRMRLRAGLIGDPYTREAMDADITEIEAMLNSVLAYLSGDGDTEPSRRIDLAALVSTLVDAYADVGREVSYTGPERLALSSRPLAIKRAISNLVDNGLKYGVRVRVNLSRVGDHAQLLVDDDGPGVPERDLQRVLTPFVRLDQARRRDTSGLGLGLAIVSNAVNREQGQLRLENRPEGGMRATILLPLAD